MGSVELMKRLLSVKYFAIATGLHLLFSVANADQLSAEKTTSQANKRWQPDDNLVSGYGIALSYPSDVLLHVTRNVERGKSVYEFKVFADGRLEYNGHHGVEISGVVKKQLAPQDVEKIEQLIDQSGIQGGASGLLETSYKHDGREYTPLAALYVNRNKNIKRGMLVNELLEHLNFWTDLETVIKVNDLRCPTFATASILKKTISGCAKEQELVRKKQKAVKNNAYMSIDGEAFSRVEDVFFYYYTYEYSVTIYSNGLLEYFGRDKVHTRGVVTTRLTPVEMLGIKTELEKYNFFDWPTRVEPETNHPHLRGELHILARFNGKNNHVYGGKEFDALFLMHDIEKIINSRRWRCPEFGQTAPSSVDLTSNGCVPTINDVLVKAKEIVESGDPPVPLRNSKEWERQMKNAIDNLLKSGKNVFNLRN